MVRERRSRSGVCSHRGVRSHRLPMAGALLVLLAPVWGGTATPPGQPTSGPGGSEYAHASAESGHYGSGVGEYWVFTPAGPQPKTAPVVVFCHGWLAMQPFVYEAWITHLVRRGNIVIYPRYQTNARTPARDFTANAAGAIKDALVRLRIAGPVRPDQTQFALVGHSAGGVIAANLAAQWATFGLPRPRAVMCVAPGRSLHGDDVWGVPLADYATIPADALLLCLTGDEDRLAGSEIAEQIIAGARRVAATNRNLVIAHSDYHGAPQLVADHDFPAGGEARPRSLDALDYFACWKLFDGLTDAAFHGKNREYALGNTPQQRDMGAWSDGVKVRELEVRLGIGSGP